MPARPPRERPGAPLFSVRAALLQELGRGEGFGGGLAARLREATSGAVDLAEGSIYPALRELEQDGLIEAAGQEPRGDRGGKPRKLYRITPEGQREAQRQREVASVVFARHVGRCDGPCHAAAPRGESVGRASEPTQRVAPGDRWVVRDGDDSEEGDGIEPT